MCLDPGQSCRRLCTFAGRMEYIWFVDMWFDANGQVIQCRVAPHFPQRGTSITDNILCPLRHIDSCDNLLHLLDDRPTTGFTLLVRYADTLASIHSLPLTPLTLLKENGEIVDISEAQVLAHGHHSLVIQPSLTSNFVIKISKSQLIDRERRIHSIVDDCPTHYLRHILPDGWGIVQGVGNGLSFIMLEGLGTPLSASHVSSNESLAMYWSQAYQALSSMHAKRVLHRDVKPSNMVLISGALVLNDFDVCCSLDDEKELAQLEVGTADYRSPRLSGKWRVRDDLLGLALSFLSLRLVFPFPNKQTALEDAINLEWVPADMKRIIESSFS